MLHDVLSSRGILAGVVFFVGVVGGSWLYSWQIHRTTDAEVAETQRKVPHLENKNEVHTTHDHGVPTDTQTLEETRTSIFSDDMSEVAPVARDEQPITNQWSGEESTTDPTFEDPPQESQTIRESRFGFGHYPEIPVDYPDPDIWDRIENMTDDSLAKDNELMARVRIKLWNQGTQTIGASYDNDGKIYPSIPGVAYVTWESKELSDGTRYQFPSRISGTPELAGNEHYFYELGEAPPGITIVTHEDGGIDPYEFLNLQR